MKKHTYEFVKKYIENEGYTLLSNNYINSKTKLEVKCNKDGHVWYPCFGDIKSGKGCPKCSGRLGPTLEYRQKFIEIKNGTLLSEEYKNIYTLLKIRCNKDGNIWEMRWNDIQQGHWCPRCAGVEVPNIDYVRHFIERKDGKEKGETCISDWKKRQSCS